MPKAKVKRLSDFNKSLTQAQWDAYWDSTESGDVDPRDVFLDILNEIFPSPDPNSTEQIDALMEDIGLGWGPAERPAS